MKKKTAKSPIELLWIEDLLPENEFQRKFMFGGFAYYFKNKMILLTIEDSSTNSYKNKKFDFAIWNGCLFPVERDSHASLLNTFPHLIPHPVLPKWLYLPIDREHFEEEIKLIIKHILHHTLLWGITPKSKTDKKSISKKSTRLIKPPVNMKKPQMFSDDRTTLDLTQKYKITDLKNIGPSSEKVLQAAGIKSGQQILKLGWKKTFLILVQKNPKMLNLNMAAALIGATTNKEWFSIDDKLKQEARLLIKSYKSKK